MRSIIDNRWIAGFHARLWSGNALPPDCSPLDLATSTHGFGFELTSAQELIIDLVASSLNGPGNCIPLSETSSDLLQKILGYSDTPVRLWLPPGTEISGESNKIVRFENPITEFLNVAGRRSGKSTIAAIFMAWLAYRLIFDKNFLDSIPLLSNTTISLLNSACDIHQSRILFRMITSNLQTLGLIPPGKFPADHIDLKSEIHGYPVQLESLTSSPGSSRGRTAAGICFDEFAHFNRSHGPMADRDFWHALKPSMATFGDRSLTIITTTPSGRSGIVWDLFQERGNRRGMLAVNLPTWELNPYIRREDLEDEFNRDEILARQEYGAEFIEPEGHFLRYSDIRKCVRRERVQIPAGSQLHMHIDIGLIHDATAIALGHLEWADSERKIVVIDRVESMKGRPDAPLSLMSVESRILEILGSCGRTKISGITFDQHQSAGIVERLQARGLPARIFTATSKSMADSYSLLRELVVSGNISIPDDERLVEELSSLECKPVSYGFKVEAQSGTNDDMADAVACVSYCLMEADRGWWGDMKIIGEKY